MSSVSAEHKDKKRFNRFHWFYWSDITPLSRFSASAKTLTDSLNAIKRLCDVNISRCRKKKSRREMSVFGEKTKKKNSRTEKTPKCRKMCRGEDEIMEMYSWRISRRRHNCTLGRDEGEDFLEIILVRCLRLWQGRSAWGSSRENLCFVRLKWRSQLILLCRANPCWTERWDTHNAASRAATEHKVFREFPSRTTVKLHQNKLKEL